MRKFDLRKFVFLLLLMSGSTGLWAQTPTPLMWGSSPFQDSLWSVDTTSWTITNRMGPTMAGFTVNGMNGIAYDPIGHKTYIIAKTATTRYLGTIDLNTGIITQIGDLGMKFATINFRADGQLFGVTGNGQTPNPETLFLINKNTAASTLLLPLGNGADGEIISYNYDDGMFYHWSGNSTMVMEKFPATAPYTPVTNIVTSGTPGGETFGAIYLGNNNFIISNITSSLLRLNSTGAYGASIMSLPDDFRGLVLPPRASFDSDTVCVGDSVNWNMFRGQAVDTAVYHWGDGTSSTVFPAGSASHTYLTAGNFTTYAILKNDSVGEDTMWSAPIRVFALPLVALLPGTDTTMCFTDTLDIVATSGGTSQWYMNGAMIVGATTSSYTVTTNGIYNMLKVNLNGCQDSSATGVKVTFGDQPVADLGPDSTICDGDTICWTLNNPVDVSYLWSNGSTTNSICVTSSGQVDVTATDSAGCAATDQVTVTVILQPTVNVSIDTSNCPTIVFNANDPNGTSWLWDFGDGNGGTGNPVSHTYTANGSYNGTVVGTNQCGTDNDNGTIDITCIVGVENAFSNSIHIAPNPSNGSFMLTAALPTSSSLSYEISDLSGRILSSKASDDVRSNWSEAIEFKGAAGLYFITVRAGEDMAVYRLIIE